MKALLFALTVSALALACNNNDETTATTTVNQDSIRQARAAAAENDTANYTSIQWLDSISQNKGTIKEGTTIDLSWRLKNVGDKPLVIISATAGCGCTTPEIPKAPLMPGQDTVITAKFNSQGMAGTQNKNVMVRANTKEKEHLLKFSVEVEKK